jgi:hypothetical protein
MVWIEAIRLGFQQVQFAGDYFRSGSISRVRREVSNERDARTADRRESNPSAPFVAVAADGRFSNNSRNGWRLRPTNVSRC